MAHNFLSGTFLETPAWHKLGIVVDTAKNSTEMSTLAGMDWETLKVQSEYQWEGNYRLSGNYQSLVRSDNGVFLGMVQNVYQPYQNRDAFDFTDSLVESGEIVYESAGVLGKGEKIWVLCRMPKSIEVTQDDVLHNYIFIMNHHDGKGSINVGPTNVRIVCQNTWNAALASGRRGEIFKIQHSSKTEQNLNQAKQILQEVNKLVDFAGNQYRELAKIQITKNQFEQYANDVVEYMYPKKEETKETNGYSNLNLLDAAIEQTELAKLPAKEAKRHAANRMLEMVLDNYDNEKNTLPGIQGTAWSAYNSVTEYTNHGMKYRGSNKAVDNERYKSENRLTSILGGTAANVNEYAYQQAVTRFKN